MASALGKTTNVVSETLVEVIKISAASYRSLLNCQLIIKIVQNLGRFDCWVMDSLESPFLPFLPKSGGVIILRWRPPSLPTSDFRLLAREDPASPTAEPESRGAGLKAERRYSPCRAVIRPDDLKTRFRFHLIRPLPPRMRASPDPSKGPEEGGASSGTALLTCKRKNPEASPAPVRVCSLGSPAPVYLLMNENCCL